MELDLSFPLEAQAMQNAAGVFALLNILFAGFMLQRYYGKPNTGKLLGLTGLLFAVGIATSIAYVEYPVRDRETWAVEKLQKAAHEAYDLRLSTSQAQDLLQEHLDMGLTPTSDGLLAYGTTEVVREGVLEEVQLFWEAGEWSLRTPPQEISDDDGADEQLEREPYVILKETTGAFPRL